jgi:hypothetical protein
MPELASFSESSRQSALQRFQLLHAGRLIHLGKSNEISPNFVTQAERILEINGLTRLNATVIDAARESLVIGQL